MPTPNKGESKEDYIKRFMSSKEAISSYPNKKQRYAVALSMWKKSHKEMAKLNFNYNIAIEESGMVNSDFIIAGTAINATTTSNNHKFLPEVLQESAKTLIGVPLLVDHENKVENIKGRVFYAGYDEIGLKVPFKAKVMDSKCREMIKDGRLNSVSVGATVDPRDVEEDTDGCLVPKHITFRELSLVAVPADEGATFGIAMKEAYKMFKEDEDDADPEERLTEEKIENHIQETDNSLSERRENMSEQKTEAVEEKVEAKTEKVEVVDKSAESIRILSEKLDKVTKELAEMKVQKVEAKVEVKEARAEVEEADEVSSYKILQEAGSLKGGAFTMIRNKY